jgi:hypothetical protein
MPPLNRFLAIFLAILWVPMTVHCELETFGILGHVAEVCCDETESCTDGICAVVENGDYTTGVNQFKVSAPTLLAFSRFLCLHAVRLIPPRREAAAFNLADVSPAWLSDWDFARRTACPARAPSLDT